LIREALARLARHAWALFTIEPIRSSRSIDPVAAGSGSAIERVSAAFQGSEFLRTVLKKIPFAAWV
jgi:hypothetical protein